MTTFYVDPSAGSDSNIGTASNAPWSTWAKVTSAAVLVGGNQILFRRGTTCVERILGGTNGATAINPIILGSYGSSTSPLPVMAFSSVPTPPVTLQRGGWIIQDIDVLAPGSTDAILISCGSSNTNKVIVRRSNIRGANSIQGGITVNVPSNALHEVPMDNFEFYGNTFSSCGNAFGWAAPGNFNFSSNVCVDNGVGAQQNGIACSPISAGSNSATSWANVSGFVYSSAVSTQSGGYTIQNIETVYINNASTLWNLLENTSTPTNPNQGEYGYVSSIPALYVNINGDPTGSSVAIGYGRTRNWVIESNVVLRQRQTGSNEASGIMLDSGAGYGIVRRNFVQDCSGNGIETNRGKFNDIYSNILINNSEGGILLGGNLGNRVFNNTVLVSSNVYAIRDAMGAAANNHYIMNNILLGSSSAPMTFAIRFTNVTVGAQTYQCQNNDTLNYVTEVSSAVLNAVTNSYHLDPNLNAQYLPVNSQLIVGGGQVDQVVDFYGSKFNIPAPVGAVQTQYPNNTLINPNLITKT